MFRMLPLPSAFDEPAQGYACRFARRVQLPLRFVCTDLGIARNDIIRGKPEAIERIAEVGGADPSVLRASTISHVQERDYLLNGEQLTRDSLRRTRLRGCVHCMKAQMADGPIWAVSIQAVWCLGSIYTCPIHSVALSEIGIGKSAMFNEWSLMAEDFLGSPAADQTPHARVPGAFESYLIDRVRNGTPAIGGEVNDLPLHVATNLVPIIGQTLSHGTSAVAPLSDDAAIKAADTGYHALREPGGLENALAHIDAAAGPRQFNQGPQHRLGRHLYDWLSRAALHPAYTPVKERVREYILDNIPVDRGTMLLGRRVEACRVHNISTLKAVTGLHHTTLRRHLQDNGLLKSDAFNGDLPMSAAEVEAWAAQMHEVVGHRAVEKYLGCSRSQLLTLLKAKMVKPMSAASIARLQRFEAHKLEELRSSVIGAAVKTGTTPNGYVGLESIGKKANCSIADVLKAAMAGDFQGIACRPENQRIDALEFDVEEAKELARGEPLPGLPANELIAYWKVSYLVVKALIQQGHLETRRARHPVHKGLVSVIPYESIERFEATFVHLRDLVGQKGSSRFELQKSLSTAGIPRAFDPALIDAPFYRRADLPL
ncbi:TniQ family protein [Shinella sp.]|uniref:TniQ family protein n=1 Tax=Shinella sp. TaxID=1870904 RepID=UPI003F710AF6